MKETFYFPHDYNAMQDEKIKMLIRKHGMEGYGIFWAIVEMLYNNANALRTDYEGIAFDVRTNCEKIESIVNDFDLFIVDGDTFGSMSIERRLNERKEKSRKAKESASYRWNNANALRTECDGNAIKEKKVKEKKEKKEIKVNDITVSTETKIKNEAFEKFNKWVDENATNVRRIKNQITEDQFTKLKEKYNSQQIMQIILNLENYKDAPKKYTSVYLTVNNWIKNESSNKSYGERNTKVPASGSREAKEQSRRNLVKLADQILGIDESEDNGRSFR